MQSPGLTIGLFGVGLDTYWEQFEGLKDRLENYLDVVYRKLKAFHPQIINLGLIDSPAASVSAYPN